MDKEIKTILIADVDEKSSSSLAKFFAERGYSVITSKVASEVIQKIQNTRIDVLVMNVELEEMKGYEVVPIVKKITPKLPIIIISDDFSLEIAKKVHQAGIFYYAMKPLDMQEMELAIRDAFKELEKEVTTSIDRMVTISTVKEEPAGVEKKKEAQLIDGKAVAKRIKEELKNEISQLKEKYHSSPVLLAIQVGENPASAVYLKSQHKGCEEVGIDFQLEQLPKEITEKELIKFIEEKNEDERVSGIILQMPLPAQINAEKVQAIIDPAKDVEGVNPENMGMLVYGKPKLAPCTALSVMELIKSTGTSIKGLQVTVVGHSSIVGKPLALLLLSSPFESATTTVCHIATRDLASHTRKADILIVAVGKAGLIKGEMIKEGAIVIDVGVNRVGDKIVGDVLFEEAKEKASLITPVPGGVGQVTTAMLLRNTIEAWKSRLGIPVESERI
ncbi:MAG TPA: hypothetical protein DHV62_07715 [Elusimicrobia bacterium]|jgi:methylenetetrahydrofolate dehydrogenase (NADP+)/methenyltetrahydrofolate cyclohydrolase|nr:hypothetical protein [Elusimicrobiota bacterium]